MSLRCRKIRIYQGLKVNHRKDRGQGQGKITMCRSTWEDQLVWLKSAPIELLTQKFHRIKNQLIKQNQCRHVLRSLECHRWLAVTDSEAGRVMLGVFQTGVADLVTGYLRSTVIINGKTPYLTQYLTDLQQVVTVVNPKRQNNQNTNHKECKLALQDLFISQGQLTSQL